MSNEFTSANFNKFLSEHKLMGSRCTQCGGLYLPPRAICPACHSDQIEWLEMSGKGKLAAFSSVYIGPSAMQAERLRSRQPVLRWHRRTGRRREDQRTGIGRRCEAAREYCHRYTVDGGVSR